MLDWIKSWCKDKFFTWSWSIKTTGYKQVKINIQRLDSTEHGVFGHLTLDDGSFDCVTLERHDIDIPTGEYKTILYQSPVHGLVPMLQGVPGRSEIEIHEGNYEKDSKGCILVAEKRDGFAIDDSKVTLKALMAKLQGQTNITTVII